MSDTLVHSTGMMGTVVTIQVVGHGDTPARRADRQAAVERAVEWFRVIESACTRFDEASELRQLCARVGEPVVVSEILFRAVQFAVSVAEESGGAFDPTVGEALVARDWAGTGAAAPGAEACLKVPERSRRPAKPVLAQSRATYRDVTLNETNRAVTLQQPLLLDLGAVAKGLAVDAAARELQPFRDFVVDAGGDLYLGGCNLAGEPWSIGIRHPRDASTLVETIRISDAAVCTSGDYDPKSRTADGGHHILDPRRDSPRSDPVPSATELASVTVIAPSAMVADALGTAAFVLGPEAGIDLLERNAVRGIMYTPELERFETRA